MNDLILLEQSRFELLPPEIKLQPHWLTWRMVQRPSDTKPRKVPVNPETGQMISPTDPANWLPFEQAVRALERRADLSGIGLALTGAPCYDGKYLVAIDLDYIEANMGEAAAKELWFSLGQPYCEWSPSGKGLRMLALSAEPLAETRCNAGGGREVYTKSRFVTITGNKRSGKPDRPGKLKDCTEGLRKMVAAWWAAAPSKATPLPSVGSALSDATTLALIQTQETAQEVERVRNMLARISADCQYEQWRTVVWSLLSTGWQCAETLARAWSESAPQRFEETAFHSVVNSYRPGHVSLGSLVFLAGQHGWREPVETRAEEPQPGRLLTVGQLMNIKPEPYRVRSVFPARGVAAIYGASGSGKSFLALDLAMAVCTGAPHWFTHKLRPAPVVYVALEGQAGMVNRVKAWQQVNARTTPSENIRFVLGDFSLTRGESVQRLQAEITGVVGPGTVLVVDTLNQASPGADENSSAEMGTIIGHANQLAAWLDCLVVLIHHSGKDATRGMRGHSSLFAAMDAVIEVVHDPKSGQRAWRVAKAKDDALGGPFLFDLVGVPLGTDDDGDPVGSCAVRQVSTLPAPSAQKAPKGSRQALAWGAVQQTGRTHFTREELEEIIKPAMPVPPGRQLSTAREVLNGLLAGGYLFENEGGSLVVR